MGEAVAATWRAMKATVAQLEQALAAAEAARDQARTERAQWQAIAGMRAEQIDRLAALEAAARRLVDAWASGQLDRVLAGESDLSQAVRALDAAPASRGCPPE